MTQKCSKNGARKGPADMTINIRGISRHNAVIFTWFLHTWSVRAGFDVRVDLKSRTPSCCLHGKTAGGPVRIPAGNILYVTADQHYVQARVHQPPCHGKKALDYTVRLAMPFREAVMQLEDARFLPCGRGVLLNPSWVRSLRKDHTFLMKDGAIFPLPVHARGETAALYKSLLASSRS